MFSRKHVFTLLTMIFTAAAGSLAAENPPDSPEVKQLLRERLEILSTIYQSRRKAHKSGAMGLDKVLQANAALLEARLELCDTKQERLKVHAEIVELARQTVETVEKLTKTAEVPQSELLDARLRFLEARIALERARSAP
jgi:outer membrane protein TolC